MTRVRRAAALVLAVSLAAGGTLLVGPQAGAAAAKIPYTCTIPGFGTQGIDIALDTDAPATMVVGETFKPTLTLTVVIPALIIGLAKTFNYTEASADGTLDLGINGATTQLHATYPRTTIPTNGKDFPVTMKIPLPDLKPSAPGTIKYTPGPLNATLMIYKNGVPESVTASCVVKNPSTAPAVDTVQVIAAGDKVSSGTSISAPAAAYGKPGTVTVTVGTTSGLPVTGSVALAGLGATRTADVVQGQAVFPLPRNLAVKAYALTATYSGNDHLLASSTTRTFSVGKGSVGGVSYALLKKPTRKKKGKAAIVVGAPSGLATPTGTVTVVLKKGRTTKTAKVALSGGRGTVKLPALAKGRWSVKVRYDGNGSYRTFAVTHGFKVKK